MGGFGSGRWSTGLTKETTDDHFDIDIRWMNKQGLLESGKQGSLTYKRVGRKTGSVSFRVEPDRIILSYKHLTRYRKWEEVTQAIQFIQTPCHFGGYRKWLRCPNCFRRVAIIYGAGKYFLCRHCYDLTYTTGKGKAYYRLLEKADHIRERLGKDSGAILQRPKGMHRKTYYRLLDELEAIESRAKSTVMSRYGADLGRLRGEIKRMEKNSCFHPGLSNGEKWEASRK